MVGLADIPCVGKFLDRISEATVDALFRGLRYMFCYKSLVNELNSEIGKLNIEKDWISRKAQEERNNGKTINDCVLTWQNDVEEILKNAEEFSPSCSCIQCLPIPNPVSRFQLGRNAAKKAKAVAELSGCGKVYLTEGIAHLPPVENLPKPATTFEEFQSRKDVYKKLWDALVNEDSPLVHGIYGMPGVGKTRMMEKIWEEAMKKKIFEKVVRVNVGSEKLNENKLQDQISGSLNCKLESQDVERRASQLENSLRIMGRVLLILDDVWSEIRLDDIIGTSFGDGSSSEGSKILLTSRKKDICLLNKCKHQIEIKTLSPDEALYLFKNAVGPDTIDSLQDESLVQKVCDECGQLPLLIHAVGKALKGKPHISWKDAHGQLEKGTFEKIGGLDPQVYTCVRLSIDNLKDDDAKSCLFLCSLFPEDTNINMKMLIQLAIGSQLIPDGESRILAMVHYLKISSLLLDSGEYHETKVHDVIRDVARSLALTDSRYAFLQVTCNSAYLPSNANYHTRKLLRLDVKTEDLHFYEDLICLDLHTLWLQSNEHPQQFSGGFFRMFGNLSFLMLENVNLSLEQFSLQPLGNLGTLSLSKCDIRKTDVSLFPKNLKILCICYCDLPRPMAVANLKYLRKLEIQQREPTWVMVSNVISSLSSLEELHVPNGFIIDHDKYHLEPVVMEISKLTYLKSLHFLFHDDNTFQGTDIFSNIDRYNIFVGAPKASSLLERGLRVPLTRSIELYGNHSQSWKGLMARAEEVRLGYSDVEVSSICSGYRRAFEDLERLYITKCDNMGYLASKSQHKIQFSLQHGATCFSKLTILQITHCSTLKYLFCKNIAKSLVQLQELGVYYCYSMEAIIMNEGTGDGKIINFPKLKSLTISYIFRLASFYAEKKYMHSGSTLSVDSSAQYEPLFDGAAAFPSLEELNIKGLPNTSVVWGKDCYNDTLSSFCKLKILRVSHCDKLETVIPQAMLHRLNNLEYIKVSECSSLRTMFPPSGASDLMHLKELRVESCWEMREIIETGEQVITDGILFPELTYLRLQRLPSLTSFWFYQSGKDYTCKVPLILPQLSSIVLKYLHDLKSIFHGANFEFHMPSLKQVEVCWCGLSTLFTFSMFRKFQLKNLQVRNCELLENIVEALRGDETCDKIITLFQLTLVEFENLPNLKSFFHNATYEFHMPLLTRLLVRTCVFSNNLFKQSVFKQLEKLEVSHCGLLEGIFEDVRGDETSVSSGRIITLSRLSSLLLYDLPKLKTVAYSANYECYMPALTEVRIVNCGLATLFKCSVFRELQQLKMLEVVDCRLLEHIVENVRVDETSDTNIILFRKLKVLKLVNLPNLTSFWCYQSRRATTCKVTFRFLRLSSIVLKYLPELKSFFYGANYEFHLPLISRVIIRKCGLCNTLFTRSVFGNLRTLHDLTVFDCELLEGIFDNAKGEETLDTSDKIIIALDKVCIIHLEGLPKLKSIFFGATYECYMPNLKYVDIIRCGLSVLFTWSVFREIQQIEKLHVSNCGTLKHIVEEVGGDKTSEKYGKSITLFRLSSITLQFLSNLKSFSRASSYVFNIPKLQRFRFIKCPQIEYFSSSKTNTSLVCVTSEGGRKEDFQDLNDYVRQNH